MKRNLWDRFESVFITPASTAHKLSVRPFFAIFLILSFLLSLFIIIKSLHESMSFIYVIYLSLFPFDAFKYRNDLCSLCGKNVFNLWQFYTFLIWHQFLKSVLSVSYITFDTWRKFFRYYIPESVISSFQPDFLVPFLYISGNWNYPYF